MDTKTLCSITLTWDEFGSISHSLHSNIPTNDYQKADAIALSAPLVTGSQLGVLAPRYSLELCGHALDFLAASPQEPEVIQLPLGAARIDLHQKDQTIVSTFHPTFSDGGTMEPEEAVRRLLTNYYLYVNDSVIDELAGFMKAVLLVTVSFYLSILPSALKSRSFSADTSSPDVQASMLDFGETIYPKWGGSIPANRFRSSLLAAQENYHSVRALV